jgi:hypothetical protein
MDNNEVNVFYRVCIFNLNYKNCNLLITFAYKES